MKLNKKRIVIFSKTKGSLVLQYNKINNRIYWREYTTVSKAIKKNEWEDEK
jgi:hypothetical protein